MKFKVLGREIAINKGATSVGLRANGKPFDAFFQSFGGSSAYTFGDSHNWLNDYKKCPPLKTIIDRKNTAFTNGNTFVANSTTNEEVKGYDNILNILREPNSIQTQTQFEAQRNTYLTLYGWSIVMNFKPSGFENDPKAKIVSRWVLPNEDLKITWNTNPFYKTERKNLIKTIKYCIGGIEYTLSPNDCFIYTHLNASYTDNMLLPASPLQGLEYPVSNIIKAYEATGSLLDSNGALGIISNDGGDVIGDITYMDPVAVDQLQRDYRGYGLSKDQRKIIITSLALKWQQMSLPIKDLMLTEIKTDDTIAIADRMGYPVDLLGIGGNRTYENASQAGVDLYQNTIIPEANHTYEQETMDLLGHEPNVKICATFDHVAAMQEDEGKKASAQKSWSQADKYDWDSDLLTRNQILERRGMPSVKNGDLYKSEWLALNNKTNE